MELWLRSLIFNIAFYVTMFVQMVVFLPLLVLPRRSVLFIVRNWARLSLWLLRVICNLKVEVRGRQHIPPGSIIFGAKHQSMLETFALIPYIDDFAYILKREIHWIPFFGWYTLRFRMIGVRRNTRNGARTNGARAGGDGETGAGNGARGDAARNARGETIRNMIAAVRRELAHGDRQIIIFPEGTRRPPGAPPAYRSGIAALYAELDLPCVPVALNCGLFWRRRGFLRYPGTATIEFLPAIAPRQYDRAGFKRELQARLEPATDALIADARAKYPYLPR